MEPQTDASTTENAVRSAVVAHWAQLLNVVRRRGGGRVDAEEVLQVGLVRALERAAQMRDPTRAQAWVGRVVRNVLTDELRQHREPALPIDEIQLPAIDQDEIECWCPLVQAERLKPEYAQILRRVVLDDIAVTEVAVELGLTANNAMVRLHRARAALEEQLRSHCGTTSARSCSECGCAERGCCPRR